MEHKARNFFDPFKIWVLLGTASRNSHFFYSFWIKSFYTALDAIRLQKEKRSAEERTRIPHEPFVTGISGSSHYMYQQFRFKPWTDSM